MSIRTSITTEASSRSWASPSRSPTPSSRGRARRSRRSTCASTKAPTRASARSMSRRSSTCADEDRELAEDEALAVANRIAAELELPVFLYGVLAPEPERRERSYFREGAIGALQERLEAGELEPDFGPRRLHPTAGATLVACRPPLVAFNLELAERDLDAAKAIAAELREAGGGLAGVRAIGVMLDRAATAQVSINVQDPFAVPLAEIVRAARNAAASHGVTVRAAELVGLGARGGARRVPRRPRAEGLRRAQGTCSRSD